MNSLLFVTIHSAFSPCRLQAEACSPICVFNSHHTVHLSSPSGSITASILQFTQQIAFLGRCIEMRARTGM